jgi:hypothetical protein
MLWTLRFRQPMGVKSVFIETKTSDMAEAEERGRTYVNAQAGPGYRYIAVERAIVSSYKDDDVQVQHDAIDETAPSGAGAAGPVADTGPRAVAGGTVPAGRIGA